ncbi:MAG: CAP domain-containing protein [Chitinophagaceae bacterium]
MANATRVQAPLTQLAEDLHTLVNRYRETRDLPPLELNGTISSEAEKHSLNMSSRSNVFGHDGFEDRIRLIAQKLGSLHKSAENIALGKFGAKEVLDVWLKSPGHRRNIEGKYTHTGIGISRDPEGTLYFTQIFTAK